MSNPFAEDPQTAPTTNEPILVEINARMVPLILRALERYKYRKSWVSDEDYQIGLGEINALQEAILTGTPQIVDAIDRLYRLVDTGLNGAVYTAAGTPPVVSPAIPAAPPSDIGQAPGLRAQLLAAQGTINAGWFGIGGRPATIADLMAALRIGSDGDTTRITNAIDAIAGDSLLAQGSQAANIFGTVKGLFTDVVGATGEGAVLGTLIAASIATSGMLGVLAGQLDRLIAALDGGGPVGPADNVLTALRGTVTASNDRNVVDAAGGLNLVQLLDQVETLLAEIRDTVQ